MSSNYYSAIKVRKNLIYFFSGKIATSIIGIALIFLLVRFLTKEEYGTYIVLLAVFELLQIISQVGIFQAAFRYVPEFRAKNAIGQLYYLVIFLLFFRFITLLFAIAVVWFCSGHIANWLNIPLIMAVMPLYVCVIFFEGMARYTDLIFDSLLLQAYSQISVLLRNGFRLLSLVIISLELIDFKKFSLEDWLIIEIIASLIGCFFSVTVLLSKLRREYQKNKSNSNTSIDFKRIYAYVLPVYLAQLLSLLQSPDMVKILVAKITDVIQAGAFGFAAIIHNTIQRNSPVFLLIGVVRPLFISHHEQGRSRKELLVLASLVLKLNVFFIAPIITIAIVLNKNLAIVLSGGKFPDSGIYLIILLLLLPIQTFRLVLGLLTVVVEEAKAGLYATFWGLLGVIGGLVFAKFYGPLALCMGLVVSELLITIQIKKNLKYVHDLDFVIDIKGFFYILFSCCFAVVCVSLTQSFLPVDLKQLTLVVSLIIGVVYVVSSYFWKPFTVQERNMINKALPKPLFVW